MDVFIGGGNQEIVWEKSYGWLHHHVDYFLGAHNERIDTIDTEDIFGAI